jgi:hypothetical protein
VPGAVDLLAPFLKTAAWTERMAAFGYGSPSTMSGPEALALAHDASPESGCGVTATRTHFSTGDTVTVAPTDYGAVPVSGTLVTLNRERITLRRQTDATGPVNTHFPRAGYRIDPV